MRLGEPRCTLDPLHLVFLKQKFNTRSKFTNRFVFFSQHGFHIHAHLFEANTKFFREGMAKLGFNILPGMHPICPVMLGDAALATKFADAMLYKGVYVIGFSYPVVPQGQARIRTQISAAHSREDLEKAINAFAEVKQKLGI